MAVSYTDIQASALTLLKTLGIKVVLTNAAGDEASTYGAFLKIKRAESSSQFAADDRKLLISGSVKTSPQVGDTVTVKGQDYYVHEVLEENPAGVCLYYTLTVIA